MKVVITRKIPGKGIEMLKEKHEVIVSNFPRTLTKSELLEFVKDADAILCTLNDQIDIEVINNAPKLKIIANYATGFNNIDIKACEEKKIFVTNTVGDTDDAVGEFTIALIMNLTKHIVPADKYVKSGRFLGWDPNIFMSDLLKNKTLGIIGAGKIGTGVGIKAHKGLDLNVLYYDLNPNNKLEYEAGARKTSIEEILAKSDIVSLHVPLNDQTHHMIKMEQLKMMKPTSILINTSRGGVIKEDDLVHALNEKVIAGAALDVFEFEPELTNGLKDLENVVLTPHIASAAEVVRDQMSEQAATNILDAFEDKKPIYCVNNL